MFFIIVLAKKVCHHLPWWHGGEGGQLYEWQTVTRGGGGSKNDQFCGDVIFEWPLRRWFRRLTVFYKIMHGQTPQYLVDPVPPLRRHLFGTNIRNELHPMCWRTQRFKNSFYPDAVKNWNNIGPEMRQTDEISTFKSTLKAMIVPEEKSIFKIHSQDLRYLYQLRVGLSPLRAHKFRHNFLDTSSDMCTC